MKTRRILVADNAAYLIGTYHLCARSAFAMHQALPGSADDQSWGYQTVTLDFQVTVICRAFCIDPIARSEVKMLDLCQAPVSFADIQAILGAFHRAFV